MSYVQAYEYVFDEIDLYYQYNYKKAYFDFKGSHSFKLAQVSMKSFLSKLDEHRFHSYISADHVAIDMRKESKLLPNLQKMCHAIRILNLFIVFHTLSIEQIRGLRVDIPPGNLVRLYNELPRNFTFLRDHLSELILRFHPYWSSEEDRVTVDVIRGSIEAVPLINVSYDYDDVVGEPSCCFPCSFFGRKEKKEKKEEELQENAHLRSPAVIRYTKRDD